MNFENELPKHHRAEKNLRFGYFTALLNGYLQMEGKGGCVRWNKRVQHHPPQIFALPLISCLIFGTASSLLHPVFVTSPVDAGMKAAASHCSQAGFFVPSGCVCVSIREWSSGCVTLVSLGLLLGWNTCPEPFPKRIPLLSCQSSCGITGTGTARPWRVSREIQYYTIYICKIQLVSSPLRGLAIFQARGIDGTEGQFVVAPCRMILNSCFIANISNFFRLRQGKKIEREKGGVWERDRSYKMCCLFCWSLN